MVCPGRERLTGRVEVDESYVGARRDVLGGLIHEYQLAA